MNKISSDKIIGAMVGAAVGDAVGFPIRSYSACDIYDLFGEKGLFKVKLPNLAKSVSFTSVRNLLALNSLCQNDNDKNFVDKIFDSYSTHARFIFEKSNSLPEPFSELSELFTLKGADPHELKDILRYSSGTINNRINDHSDNMCLGAVISIGVFFSESDAALMGANVAALTHGHDLALLSSAFAACLISTILRNPELRLYDAVIKTKTTVMEMLVFSKYLSDFSVTFDTALELAESDVSQLQAIRKIGTGYSAHDAVMIAVYSSLKHFRGYGAAVMCAVNHDGDSAMTGFLTGGIMGAYLGKKHIPQKLLEDVRLLSIIENIC